jgi:hypothetical protein
MRQSGARLLLLEDGRKVLAHAGMMARMTPAVGDYFVIQADGYANLNPKDVFERKYEIVFAAAVEAAVQEVLQPIGELAGDVETAAKLFGAEEKAALARLENVLETQAANLEGTAVIELGKLERLWKRVAGFLAVAWKRLGEA